MLEFTNLYIQKSIFKTIKKVIKYLDKKNDGTAVMLFLYLFSLFK